MHWLVHPPNDDNLIINKTTDARNRSLKIPHDNVVRATSMYLGSYCDLLRTRNLAFGNVVLTYEL